jgi:hypothetical protein
VQIRVAGDLQDPLVLREVARVAAALTASAALPATALGVKPAFVCDLGAGAVTNHGTLVFNRSNAMTVSNAISGSGTITQMGAGALSLTGANSIAAINKRFKPMGIILSSSTGGESATAYDPC